MNHIKPQEDLIGYWSTTSLPGGVYFSAKLNPEYCSEGYTQRGWVDQFDALVNQGNGLNVETGVFSAPITGFYKFNFLGATMTTNLKTLVVFYLNDTPVRRFGTTTTNETDVVLHGSLQTKLDQNDTVRIKIRKGKIYYECDDGLGDELFTFSGYLVAEEF